jgi:hypothetical protein
VIVTKAETIPKGLDKSAQFDENQSSLIRLNNTSFTINEFENDSELFQKRRASRSKEHADSTLPCIKPEIGENYSNIQSDLSPNQFYSSSDQSYSPRVTRSVELGQNTKQREEIELRDLRTSYPPREQVLSSRHLKLPPLNLNETRIDSFNKKDRRTSLTRMELKDSNSRTNKAFEDSFSEDENVVVSKYRL